MERADRLIAAERRIANTEGRIEQQRGQVTRLDFRGLHSAAVIAREVLLVLGDRLVGQKVSYEIMERPEKRLLKSSAVNLEQT